MGKVQQDRLRQHRRLWPRQVRIRQPARLRADVISVGRDIKGDGTSRDRVAIAEHHDVEHERRIDQLATEVTALDLRADQVAAHGTRVTEALEQAQTQIAQHRDAGNAVANRVDQIESDAAQMVSNLTS